jgi:hypothetical protein
LIFEALFATRAIFAPVIAALSAYTATAQAPPVSAPAAIATAAMATSSIIILPASHSQTAVSSLKSYRPFSQ